MKQVRKRLSYANVMSSIAVFLVLGGATAFAASKIRTKRLAANAVTTAKIKRNAVTAAKIKRGAVTQAKIQNGAVTGAKVRAGSLTGASINLATLGTVPSAATATTANALAGRTPFSFFMNRGEKTVVTIAPFTVTAKCAIDEEGSDVAELQLSTAVNAAAMDDNSGDELEVFNVEDNPARLIQETGPTGNPMIESDEGQLVAVAPNGTTIATENQAVGVNVGDHIGQCFFAGTVTKLG